MSLCVDWSMGRLSVVSAPPLALVVAHSVGSAVAVYGAGDGTRTRNLLITNQLLYPLSYASAETIDP